MLPFLFETTSLGERFLIRIFDNLLVNLVQVRVLLAVIA